MNMAGRLFEAELAGDLGNRVPVGVVKPHTNSPCDPVKTLNKAPKPCATICEDGKLKPDILPRPEST